MRPSLAIQAPAKLNLALSVGPASACGSASGGGGGGMHPICSWMVTINLFDELLITRLEEGRLSRYAILWHAQAKRRSEINWSVSKDLAVRAHLALEKHIGRTLPVQLKLEKRIPVGGGLGGGSSDAAAMLRAVNRLFDLGLSLDELAAVGATIGSDVPFLVRGGSAIVEGLGDRIAPHDSLPVLHAVLAFPAAVCPTARVYGLFDEMMKNGAAGGGPAWQGDAVRQLAIRRGGQPLPPDAPFNDLARAAIAVAPQLQDDLQSLANLAQRPAHITGSGSSIFVLCDDEAHACALAEASERTLDLPAVAVESWNPPHD